MSVQLIKNKRITKFDVNDPNFKPLPKPEPEEINGNLNKMGINFYEKIELPANNEILIFKYE